MRNELLNIRLAHNVKRVFLAEALKTDVSTIYRWEIKQAPIPYDQLLAVALFFEVAATDIVPALGKVQVGEKISV